MSGSIRDQPFVEQLKGFFFLRVALAGFCQERLTYRHLSLDGQYAGVENAREEAALRVSQQSATASLAWSLPFLPLLPLRIHPSPVRRQASSGGPLA
jgi:hypothetical protein